MDVSNPDKLIFPEAGFTKRDLVAHYERVGTVMLGHLGDSPLTLERYPSGIDGKGFMQKNASAHFPDTIRRFEVTRRGGITVYAVVDRVEDIAYLANQGTVAFHTWTSRTRDIMRPDRIVIDLDPPAGEVDAARAAAAAVRELMDRLGLTTVPVATGSKGYHVVAPIAAELSFARIERLAHGIAAVAAAADPERLTLEFTIEARRGRVFVDWLRNRFGATTVVPWSLRPRTGAPVAVPIRWDEMATTPPDAWRLDTVETRLSSGDPLADAATSPSDAEAALAELERLLRGSVIELEPFDRFGRQRRP